METSRHLIMDPFASQRKATKKYIGPSRDPRPLAALERAMRAVFRRRSGGSRTVHDQTVFDCAVKAALAAGEACASYKAPARVKTPARSKSPAQKRKKTPARSKTPAQKRKKTPSRKHKKPAGKRLKAKN
jgi:hypothetical protein